MLTPSPWNHQQVGSFPSAADMGVELDWSFAFVGPGTSLISTPGVIALDVGGSLAPGVIDHHHGGDADMSTAELVASRPELSVAHLLGPLWQEAAGGVSVAGRRVPIRIVTHHSPDFDGLVAIATIQRLVQHGLVSRRLRLLGKFAALVDQGRFHGDAFSHIDDATVRLPLHEIYQLAQGSHGGSYDGHLSLLEHGLRLLDRFLDQAEAWHRISSSDPRGGSEVSVPVLIATTDDEELAPFLSEIEQARRHYQEDLKGAVVESIPVPVRWPDGTVSARAVKAIAFADQPSCKLFKYYARRDRFVLMVVPFAPAHDDHRRAPSGAAVGRGQAPSPAVPEGRSAAAGRPAGEPTIAAAQVGGDSAGGDGLAAPLADPPQRFPRVVISTNPEHGVLRGEPPERSATREQGIPTLTGLGRRLEALEARACTKLGRSRPSGPRKGYTSDYCDNQDPWYDGQGHGYTIVDSPRVGTLLHYASILRQVGFTKFPQGVTSADGDTSPAPQEGDRLAPRIHYWEPTLLSAFAVHVALAPTAAAVADREAQDRDTPDALTDTTRSLYTALWEANGQHSTAGIRWDSRAFSTATGAHEQVTFDISIALAPEPISLDTWVSHADAAGRRAPDTTRIVVVHEFGAGQGVAVDNVFHRLLCRSRHDVLPAGPQGTGPSVTRDLEWVDERFALRAPSPPPSRGPAQPPPWLIAAVQAAVIAAGLKAWRRWLRSALDTSTELRRSDLVTGLARYWRWESVWLSTAVTADDPRALALIERLETQGQRQLLLDDTRRLAARLDHHVERLEAADEARASRILNNALFLIAAATVMQFFQTLQSTELAWHRDWWWLTLVPALFVGLLAWANGWLNRSGPTPASEDLRR